MAGTVTHKFNLDLINGRAEKYGSMLQTYLPNESLKSVGQPHLAKLKNLKQEAIKRTLEDREFISSGRSDMFGESIPKTKLFLRQPAFP